MESLIIDNIKLRAKLLRSVCDVAQKYFEELKKYISGTNPQEYKILSSSLDRSFQSLLVLESFKEVNLGTLYAAYDSMSNLEADITGYILMFNNQQYSRAALLEMSSGRHSDMRDDINRVIANYNRYRAMTNDDIFDHIFKMTARAHDSYYGFLYDHHNHNPFTNELIRRLLPIVVGDRKLFVDGLLAEQKHKIFSPEPQYPVRVKTDAMSGHEAVIYRYNLHPVTTSMTLPDLFKLMKWDWDDGVTDDRNLIKIAFFGRNIIMIRRPSATPIEFDFRGVLDNNYTADLKIKPMSGLSKKFIARYNTTQLLSKEDLPKRPAMRQEPPPNRAIQIYSGQADTKDPHERSVSYLDWYVIETINGTLYRLLSNNDDYTTVGKDLLGLLAGVSLLPTLYNKCHSEWIGRKRGDMFDPTAKLYLSKYADYSKAVANSEPIKNRVCEKLQSFIVSSAESVRSSRDFFELFNSDAFYTAVVDVITNAVLKNDPFVSRLNSAEYNITLISRTNNIILKFMKAVTRTLSGETLQHRVFSEYVRADIISMLSAQYAKIIKKAADILDADKTWTGEEISLKEFIMTN